MAQHSDVRIVRLGFRRGQENQVRLETSSQVRLPDQRSAYSAALKSHVDGQVRQVSAVVEVVIALDTPTNRPWDSRAVAMMSA